VCIVSSQGRAPRRFIRTVLARSLQLARGGQKVPEMKKLLLQYGSTDAHSGSTHRTDPGRQIAVRHFKKLPIVPSRKQPMVSVGVFGRLRRSAPVKTESRPFSLTCPIFIGLGIAAGITNLRVDYSPALLCVALGCLLVAGHSALSSYSATTRR
jgi:hypothetical protein